ncbi:hypothetical protein [Devosia sp.]|uniref:hypothetical protein n=1 Tax=Devosia sp. TaxID=1871048 RepID=UPI0035AF9341
MSEDPEPPRNPWWRLNPARIVLLIMGALLALYIASALLGGLGNYQALREASDAAKATSAN